MYEFLKAFSFMLHLYRSPKSKIGIFFFDWPLFIVFLLKVCFESYFWSYEKKMGNHSGIFIVIFFVKSHE